MPKMALLILTSLIPNSFHSMQPQKSSIKPDSFKMGLRLQASNQHNDILAASLDYYEKYMVETTQIQTISSGPLIHPDGSKATGYEATLHNGHQITGFYFKTGPYKNEIWALFWPIVDGEIGDPFPIPQKNFFILQSFYETYKMNKQTHA